MKRKNNLHLYESHDLSPLLELSFVLSVHRCQTQVPPGCQLKQGELYQRDVWLKLRQSRVGEDFTNSVCHAGQVWRISSCFVN